MNSSFAANWDSSRDPGDQITLQCGPAAGEIDDLGRKLEGIILELVE